MKKRLLKVTVISLAVLFVFSLIGCSITAKNSSTEKTFEQTIDEKLINISNSKDNIVSLSSNPYDYIKGIDSNKDYKYIVLQGEKSLNYMLNKFANSDKNGLEAYIMAIACSEILKENPASKNWASGGEWYDNYIKGKY
ncbi:hypothetical protein EHS13_23635 [Paenibacillus psychroresistens]|uniref:Uncharacterized protein n=1 Tax=Paenibacillus psychroresistens TaxID=1778678 RepID=A0A6B8RP96_9BACL|nr:hypothetical protein [Paenibacillus psychroresistens]QGQ97667.1 hypothetical protein EHS13_23635 [Paenibacillus psychroresistens]